MRSFGRTAFTLAMCLCGALGLLTVPGATGAAAQDDGVGTTDQTLDDCKLMPDDGARLTCYDRVIKAGRENVPGPAPSTPLPGSTPTSQPVATGGPAGPSGGPGSAGGVASGTPVKPPMTVEEQRAYNEATFGLPKEARETSADKAAKVGKIRVQIANVETFGANQLRITTADGAVWDEVGSSTFKPPRAGEYITIRRRIMGGLLCSLKNHRTFRCERVDRPDMSSN